MYVLLMNLGLIFDITSIKPYNFNTGFYKTLIKHEGKRKKDSEADNFLISIFYLETNPGDTEIFRTSSTLYYPSMGDSSCHI
jgi:hypothetical protein